ncbi:MAG TPA: VWA domain-containing protein [Candidatus Hydrogenedentes bacterium]|nr:VWA domain-containing protein [Candidatus Hydrogenedentota bacterium]
MGVTDIQFAFPAAQAPLWISAGLLVTAAAALLLFYSERRRRRRLSLLVDAGLAPRLLEGYTDRLRLPLAVLTVLGVAFLLLALAQPKWGSAWRKTARSGRDVLVLLDTSESMNAQNPLPTRMEKARQKIQSLLDLSPGDRFGLVAFAGEAACQVPLTLDHNYFRTVLDAVSTDTLSIEGSDLAAALREARRMFDEDVQKSGGDQRHARVVLVVTDGEQTSGDALATAAEMRDYAGIYVLGIGTPDGAQITYPAWMQRYARVPEDQRTRLSKLDEENLSRLAKENGGAYARATADNADVAFLHGEWEQVRARALSSELRFNRVNRYRWPLAAAMLCFAAEAVWLALIPVVRARRLRAAGRVAEHA